MQARCRTTSKLTTHASSWLVPEVPPTALHDASGAIFSSPDTALFTSPTLLACTARLLILCSAPCLVLLFLMRQSNNVFVGQLIFALLGVVG